MSVHAVETRVALAGKLKAWTPGWWSHPMQTQYPQCSTLHFVRWLKRLCGNIDSDTTTPAVLSSNSLFCLDLQAAWRRGPLPVLPSTGWVHTLHPAWGQDQPALDWTHHWQLIPAIRPSSPSQNELWNGSTGQAQCGYVASCFVYVYYNYSDCACSWVWLWERNNRVAADCHAHATSFYVCQRSAGKKKK